jgi:hypothetical protein
VGWEREGGGERAWERRRESERRRGGRRRKREGREDMPAVREEWHVQNVQLQRLDCSECRHRVLVW